MIKSWGLIKKHIDILIWTIPIQKKKRKKISDALLPVLNRVGKDNWLGWIDAFFLNFAFGFCCGVIVPWNSTDKISHIFIHTPAFVMKFEQFLKIEYFNVEIQNGNPFIA